MNWKVVESDTPPNPPTGTSGSVSIGVCKMNPTVTRIDGDRYRVVGGTLANGWEPRPGHEAWCEMTVRDGQVVGFGGEVWPSAWPHLFRYKEPSVQQPLCVVLTDAGQQLFATA